MPMRPPASAMTAGGGGRNHSRTSSALATAYVPPSRSAGCSAALSPLGLSARWSRPDVDCPRSS